MSFASRFTEKDVFEESFMGFYWENNVLEQKEESKSIAVIVKWHFCSFFNSSR